MTLRCGVLATHQRAHTLSRTARATRRAFFSRHVRERRTSGARLHPGARLRRGFHTGSGGICRSFHPCSLQTTGSCRSKRTDVPGCNLGTGTRLTASSPTSSIGIHIALSVFAAGPKTRRFYTYEVYHDAALRVKAKARSFYFCPPSFYDIGQCLPISSSNRLRRKAKAVWEGREAVGNVTGIPHPRMGKDSVCSGRLPVGHVTGWCHSQVLLGPDRGGRTQQQDHAGK
jgi:hypothetical protein